MRCKASIPLLNTLENIVCISIIVASPDEVDGLSKKSLNEHRAAPIWEGQCIRDHGIFFLRIADCFICNGVRSVLRGLRMCTAVSFDDPMDADVMVNLSRKFSGRKKK